MNSVLLYTGNVASSPTVLYLGRCRKVWVPLFELLDEYQLSRFVENKGSLASLLVEVLSAVYQRRFHELLAREKRKNYTPALAVPSREDTPHTFFKWRPFDTGIEGADLIAETFAKADARPVTIARKSLITQALKIHLSETIYGGRHQQFKAGWMTPAEYEQYLEEQKGVLVELDRQGLENTVAIAKNFLARTKRLMKARERFFAHSSETFHIFSEDLFGETAHEDKFSGFFATVFKDTLEIDFKSEIMTRKSGLSLANCSNADSAFSDKRLMALETEFQQIFLPK